MKPTTLRAQADMNITPMIDVLLVLLVIFMASLPLSQKGLDVDLPAETTAMPSAVDSQIVIEYLADRRAGHQQAGGDARIAGAAVAGDLRPPSRQDALHRRCWIAAIR